MVNPYLPQMLQKNTADAVALTPVEPTQAQTVVPDYNALTADQLRSLLDEKGVKYLARDDKPTLIGLLTQPAKKEE